MMKYMLILLILVSITSCGPGNEQNANTETNNFRVGYNGALKNMMHKGDLSVKAELKDFENTEHFYALGALENLKGEIQIFDSKPFNSIVADSVLSFDNSFTKNATLLVYASISKWKSITIPDSVLTFKQLENFIELSAKMNKIQIDKPFPFLLEGTAASFDWHVINWKDGDTNHSHDNHINSGMHGKEKERKVEMLGFYSNSHHAIFTHHSSNMHIHVKTDDNKIAGHIDGLTLGKGMILKLPD